MKWYAVLSLSKWCIECVLMKLGQFIQKFKGHRPDRCIATFSFKKEKALLTTRNYLRDGPVHSPIHVMPHTRAYMRFRNYDDLARTCILPMNAFRAGMLLLIIWSPRCDHENLMWIQWNLCPSFRIIRFPGSVIQFLWSLSESYFNYGSCICCFPGSIVSFSDPWRKRWIEVSLYMISYHSSRQNYFYGALSI
jgi:hypothetical protein